jgi:hypothetical protein
VEALVVLTAIFASLALSIWLALFVIRRLRFERLRRKVGRVGDLALRFLVGGAIVFFAEPLILGLLLSGAISRAY